MHQRFVFFLFGVTGNLSQIKVLPALYDLFDKGLLSPDTPIVGLGRKSMSRDEFKEFIIKSLQSSSRLRDRISQKTLDIFFSNLRYLQGDFSDDKLYMQIQSVYDEYSCHRGLYYLATFPSLYHTIFSKLKEFDLTKESLGFKRLLIEKPIGTNFETSHQLNELLSSYFKDDQVFRLDHYLGKETLQNVLTFRFANGLLEPLFSHEYIDHIQISALETFGIGRRGGYYDSVGALRDVGQNHLLQMLTLVTMEDPKILDNEHITNERVSVLASLVPDPSSIVFGQYAGYTGEENVLPDSRADTFFALRCEVSNKRFKGVPIYLRAGKCLAVTSTEISIVFKPSVSKLFSHLEHGSSPNVLTFWIQPKEGISIRFLAKRPGHEHSLQPQTLHFSYDRQRDVLPDAYERLIADAIKGDQTFFNDASEVELQWKFVDALQKSKSRPLLYDQGTNGPKQADALLTNDGRIWLDPME